MTNPFSSDSKPAGSGYVKLGDMVKQIANQSVALRGIKATRATVIADGVIRIDEDGYNLNFADGDYDVLFGQTFNPGDRVAVMTIGAPRGKVLVLGQWKKTPSIPVEGVDIISTDVAAGWVLTAVGDGTSIWVTPNLVVSATQPTEPHVGLIWVDISDPTNPVINVAAEEE